MTLTISSRQTGKRLALHLAAMTASLPDPNVEITWSVGVADLSRWTRWRLRRVLERAAPATVTVELNDLVGGDPFSDVPNLPCWVTQPGKFVRLEGGDIDLDGVPDIWPVENLFRDSTFRAVNPVSLTDDHVDSVCRMGQGADCCRYLTIGPEGLECAKLTPLKATLDQRVATGSFTARGDNCDGIAC